MSAPSWPSGNSFPQAFRTTPQFVDPMQAEFNTMQSGPPKGKALDTVAYTIWTGKILLVGATQIAMWRTFYRTTTAFGTTSFTWNDPVDGSSKFYIIPQQPVGTHLGSNAYELTLVIQEVPQ